MTSLVLRLFEVMNVLMQFIICQNKSSQSMNYNYPYLSLTQMSPDLISVLPPSRNGPKSTRVCGRSRYTRSKRSLRASYDSESAVVKGPEATITDKAFCCCIVWHFFKKSQSYRGLEIVLASGLKILLTLNFEFESWKPSATIISPSKREKNGTSLKLSFSLKTEVCPWSSLVFKIPIVSGLNLLSSVDKFTMRPTIRTQSGIGRPNSPNYSTLSCDFKIFSISSKWL